MTWRAGQTFVFRIRAFGSVKRSAWRIVPLRASLARSKSGRIGKPAASADVQPSGRSAFEARS